YREIAKYFDCSYKTIQNELKNIKSLLPNNWKILSTRGVRVQLKKPISEATLHTFSYSKEDLTLHILEQLLWRNACTLEGLSEDLHVSQQSIYQALQSIPALVNELGMALEKKPYRLKGREWTKRLLIYQMYREKNRGAKYSREVPQYEYLLPLRRMLLDSHGITLTNHGFQSLGFFIELTHQRIKQGFHSHQVSQKTRQKTLIHPFFNELEPFFNSLESIMNHKLST